MARKRNISIAVPADLPARYAALGLADRRAVLADVRARLTSLLRPATPGVAGRDGATVTVTAELPPRLETEEQVSADSRREPGEPVALPAGWRA